jgi:Mor family transcriptional regulator
MQDFDIITDMLQRVADKLGKLPKHAAEAFTEIEVQARNDWGGQRHYIAKVGETGRQQMAQRDAAILADHRRGEHEELLSRRWGISVRRIRQIVSGG